MRSLEIYSDPPEVHLLATGNPDPNKPVWFSSRMAEVRPARGD